MWKNRFQRKSIQKSEGDEVETDAETTADQVGSEQAPREARPLPDKAERIALYRILEREVQSRCESFAKLTDPRSLGVKSFFRSKNTPPVTLLGIRKRQLDFFQLHLLPTLAAALLLEVEDVQADLFCEKTTNNTTTTSSATSTSSSRNSNASLTTHDQVDTETDTNLSIQDSDKTTEISEDDVAAKSSLNLTLSDPVACITLLISNLVLVSRGNYDARVRNILKTVCVPLLEKALPNEEEMCDRRRALYFLTEQHTKKKNDANKNDKKKKGTRRGTKRSSSSSADSTDGQTDDEIEKQGDEGKKEKSDQALLEHIMDDAREDIHEMKDDMTDKPKKERPVDEITHAQAESSEENSGTDDNDTPFTKATKEQMEDGAAGQVWDTGRWQHWLVRDRNQANKQKEDPEEKPNSQGERNALNASIDKPEKKEEEEEEEEEEKEEAPPMDWERTTRVPKLSRNLLATHQFEAIERAIATDILKELVERDQAAMNHAKKSSTWKDNVLRGLQITTVGVVVGGLFAVTGGLAAPGLVAAIAALGVHSTAVFAALTTTTALASMFGVVGGGLGAYKMSKRTRGLSEWRIRKETTSTTKSGSNQQSDSVKLRGLHSHVCVSGWLAEKCDFQRPFGVKCNDPTVPPLRALQRFFCVHDPEKVKDAETILKQTEQKDLWAQLKEEHGETPDDLLPLNGETGQVLSKEYYNNINNVLMQHVLPEEAVGKMKAFWETNTMLVQMVAKNNELQATASFIPENIFDDDDDKEMMQLLKAEAMRFQESYSNPTAQADADGSARLQEDPNQSHASEAGDAPIATSNAPLVMAERSIELESTATDTGKNEEESAGDNSLLTTDDSGNEREADEIIDAEAELSSEYQFETMEGGTQAHGNGKAVQTQDVTRNILEAGVTKVDSMNDHLEIIWDWQATYSGEMYTLSWETDFLLRLCRVATVLFMEISDTLGKQILSNALVGSVVAIPSALLAASIVIDDPYQIISLRSRKAGIELAMCLLTSDEHRPISLVGFSFGARLIFDCLLELARHQLLWQEQQEQLKNCDGTAESQKKGRNFILGGSGDGDRITYFREPASIIEDVILIGMPRTMDKEEWITCREIVGGRLVNCYNRKDWIVSYMINVRCFGAIQKTCGTHPVENMEGVENYEVSEFASTHDRYLAAVPQILHHVAYSQPRPSSLRS